MKEIILIALEHEAPIWQIGIMYFPCRKNPRTKFQVIQKFKPIEYGIWNSRWNQSRASCTKWKFVERDKGKCPESIEVMLPKDPVSLSFGVGYTCSTGDNFVTDPNLEIPAHVVDMEAFAIAKACLNEHVDFKCYKYVSDSADDTADTSWLDNVQKGEEHFINIYKKEVK